MTIMIELPPEIEAGLAAQAAAHGEPLPQYLQRLLREQLPVPSAAALTPHDRATAWREAVRGLPHTPPLSDEAISRENLYAARG